jgi:signal transduction histidine kinase
MQKNALRDLLARALAPTIFMNMPLVAQTVKVGGDGSASALNKKIVERHGGKNWVESEPGRGAAFFSRCQLNAT